jgi:hypothetical protein
MISFQQFFNKLELIEENQNKDSGISLDFEELPLIFSNSDTEYLIDYSTRDWKHVDELLCLRDSLFIHATYLCLLGRDVDSSGLGFYLNELRTLNKTKFEIIDDIANSDEGEIKGKKLKGFKRRKLRESFLSAPIIGGLFRFCQAILLLPSFVRCLAGIENEIVHISIKLEELQNKLNAQRSNDLNCLTYEITKIDKRINVISKHVIKLKNKRISNE